MTETFLAVSHKCEQYFNCIFVSIAPAEEFHSLNKNCIKWFRLKTERVTAQHAYIRQFIYVTQKKSFIFATGCVEENFKHITCTFSKNCTVCYSKPCAFHMPASMRSLFAHPPPRPKCSHSESCLDVTKWCLFHLISGWLKFSTPVRTSIPEKNNNQPLPPRTKCVSELWINGLWKICVRSQFKERRDLYVFFLWLTNADAASTEI